MMAVTSSEHRPLKRQKLAAPDVYPQDPKQREDELDDVSVRHGFTHRPQIQDEYGTALVSAFTSAKIASNFNAILKKKTEINQLPDTGKKRQQINIKDSFWLVTPRSKAPLEVWFKDLAGSKPLSSLGKKVPIFPKREEMLLTLCEYSVPFFRAAWFIKMFSFHHESKMAESKMKRRPQPDLSQEWTQTITKFLKEHLAKIAEVYIGNPSNAASSTQQGGTATSIPSGGSTPSAPQSSPLHGSSSSSVLGSSSLITACQPQLSEYLRNWNYSIQLSFHMYRDGLLDRQEFLEWVIDAVVRMRQIEQDLMLRVVLPLPLQYLDQIAQSEVLSRKLAYYSAMKLRQLSTEPHSDADKASGQGNANNCNSSVANNASQKARGPMFQEYLSCNQHRPVILALSCFMQAFTLDCPTSMVWNICYEGKGPQWLMGSPLDVLPCAPSELPLPARANSTAVKKRLKVMEEQIRIRSRAAENRWSLDKASVNINGSTITKVLSTLEALDTHIFSKVDLNNSVDTLYTKIFTSNNKENGTEGANTGSVTSNTTGISTNNGSVDGNGSKVTSSQEEAVIRTLCEWAVSVQRSGHHRALVVARLLEKRQNDLVPPESEGVDEKEGFSNSAVNPYVFQDLLLKFLDTQAPVYDENSLSVRSQEFGNLVLLFSELIRQDVFSHDAYMCTLISRGDLATATPDLRHGGYSMSRKKEEGTDNIDADLDKIIQDITKDAGAPDSPKDDVNTSLEDQSGSSRMERGSGGKLRPPRHLIYAQHFPLPSDEAYNHEINQRYVLLYGVGKARDETRHTVKKLSKEIMKLFSKKFSIDIAEGGKVKRSSRGEINFELILSRFKALSYFDQHIITNQVSSQIMEMLSGCGSGSLNHLPMLDHISFLMDLMEVAQNIQGLLELCNQIIKEVVDIECQLVERQCLVGSYCPQLTLHVVGVLRKYHSCLLVSQEQTMSVFDGLCRLVKNVSNPSDCCSPDRVVLAHLHDLYTSCTFLKSKHHESFSVAYPKIKQALYSTIPPIAPPKVAPRWNTQFMEEYIKNPKLKIEPSVVKQLSDPVNRFSFACSAIVEACVAVTNERLNDIAILCAELTASCNALSMEWLKILNMVCCPSECINGCSELLVHLDLRDPRAAPTIHASLSVLAAILIARHCFTLNDFLNHVVFMSLKAAWNNGKGNTEAEPGARLTCYLLLRIFKSIDSTQTNQYGSGSPQNVPAGISQRSIRMSCDRNLLEAAAHHSFTVAPVLAVLKAMLIVSDAMSGQSKSQASISDILGTSDVGSGSNDSDMMGKGGDKACLADFARFALRQICSQEWVRECCLKCPKELCSKDNLLDRLLSPKQAQRLLYLICYPDSQNNQNDMSIDHHSTLYNILEDLDEWTLRISWLDLKLMYEQHRGVPPSQQAQQELNTWLDSVAQAVIHVFQQNQEQDQHRHKSQNPRSISLVAPLISKLPKAVQGRVLKAAGEFLSSVNFGAFSTKTNTQQTSGRMPGSASASSQQQPTPPMLTFPVSSHRPFLQLVLMCLEGQDEQLMGLLESLKEQLNQAVTLYKEEKGRGIDDSHSRQQIRDALRLRFALVGSLFDTIVASCSSSITCEWAQLLVSLIMHGVVDLTNNSELFTNILDMLSALIHSVMVFDNSAENREENRRSYAVISLMKKMKKELLDNNNVSLRLVRQLVPFPKVQTEVITLDPWGTLVDTKGNKLQDFEKDKKHGLQVSEKQKLAPWDLLDGQRMPAPLSWIWFAATKLDRKPLKYEESHRLQRFHNHFAMKPTSYFLEPIQLPPEDLEPVQDKTMLPIKEEVKAPDTPSSDQSPRGNSKRGGKTSKARRVRTSRQSSVPSMGPANTMQGMPYGNPNYNQGGQNQWPGSFQHQPSQPQPNPSQYCSQQIPPAGGPRYANATPQTRNAVRSFIMHRTPAQPNFSGMPISRQGPMMRASSIRTTMPGAMQGSIHAYNGGASLQNPMGQGMPSQSSQMYNPVGGMGGPQSTSGVPNQGGMPFTSYQQNPMSGNQMMGQGPTVPGGAGGQGIMPQGYQQGYQNTPGMLSIRQQQPFMAQTINQNQMVQRPQYMGGPSANQSLTMMGGNQAYNRAGMQGMSQGQNSNILRQRVIMGGGPVAGGKPTGQTGNMMGHMQRSMGGVPQQQQGQQQNTQQAQQMMHGNSQSMGYGQPPGYNM